MREEADEVLCLEIYEEFSAIGTFYGDFRQITDQQVIDILTAYRFTEPERPAT